ncbi:MAG: FAD-dependent oxidoreductase [Deltaproteobacteria bacterium]|nr:FAD-dependent oxidoreductase [Deltaproteobacteria bacterium]
MHNHYDIIVIGAGPGGASAAALLAKQGKRVLLVDKNKKAGGRMMTLHRNGFTFEYFPIYCVPIVSSRYEELLKEIDVLDQVDLTPPEVMGTLLYENEAGVMREWQMRGNVLSLLRTLGIPWWNFKGLYQSIVFLAKLFRLPEEEINKLYKVSAMDYVDQFPLPKGLRTYFLATFGEAAFEMTSDKTSAAEAIKLFQQSKDGSAGYFGRKGIGFIFELCAKAVEDMGNTVLMKTRINSIDVEAGRVTGITTQSGDQYFAPVVVSGAGLRQTVLKLVGENHFAKDYVDWVRGLEGNLGCVGYRWILNKPLLKSPMYIYFPEGCVATYNEFEEMAAGERKPSRSYVYLGTTSIYPELTQEGKQLVYAVMSCMGDPEIDIQPYLDYVTAMVKKFMPEVFDCIELEEKVGPANVPGFGTDAILPGMGGETYGLALTVDQAGHENLKGHSPIEGLFHVGSDAGGSGVGTHQAVDSAFNVTKLVLDHMKSR